MIEIIYELYIYNISISCIFFIGIRSHNKIVNKDDYIPQNFYRRPSIDASHQVSVHFAKRFQTRRFLEIDQPETRIACGSHVCLTDRN